MNDSSQNNGKSKTLLQELVSRAMETRFLGWLLNTSLAKLLIEAIVPKIIKKARESTQSISKPIAKSSEDELDTALMDLARSVVHDLGYIAAMVAPYEQGDLLPAKAFYIDPEIADMNTIRGWEHEVQKYSQRPVSITDPAIARVHRYGNDEERQNLSVRAIEAGEPLITDEIYDLFRPVAPEPARHVVNTVQKEFGIKKLIAVPFFIDVESEGQLFREVVGNLFAATKKSTIEQREIQILKAFGQQAASAIEAINRRRRETTIQKLILKMQANLSDESVLLQSIAESIVMEFGYVGAMVAPYESGGSLPVRGFMVDPKIATIEQIRGWEQQVQGYSLHPVSLTDPSIARVNRYGDNEEKKNLSVRAIEAGKPLETDEIYDLFRPIAPEASRTLINTIQKEELGIKKLIAVPFFFESEENGEVRRDVWGNLFTATRSRSFSQGEIELLRTLGQQAAAGIRNARILKYAEERKVAAQNFAKMAFAATAYLHELRNHIAAFQIHLQLLQMFADDNKLSELDELNKARTSVLKERLKRNNEIVTRLKTVNEILDNLREPWKRVEEKPTNVNKSLTRALDKVFSSPNIKVLASPNQASITGERESVFLIGVDELHVSEKLANEIPPIRVSEDMLREAFSIIIKNAVDALLKGDTKEKRIWVESQLSKNSSILVIVRDNGVGIKPENIDNIFEYGWTTSQVGMGFGLYWTRDLVKGLGGEINVTSKLNEGTKFEITLPTVIAESVVLNPQDVAQQV